MLKRAAIQRPANVLIGATMALRDIFRTERSIVWAGLSGPEPGTP